MDITSIHDEYHLVVFIVLGGILVDEIRSEFNSLILHNFIVILPKYSH